MQIVTRQQTHPEQHSMQQHSPAFDTLSGNLFRVAAFPFVVPAAGIATAGFVILSRVRFVVTNCALTGGRSGFLCCCCEERNWALAIKRCYMLVYEG
jgi:hypothetical protein